MKTLFFKNKPVISCAKSIGGPKEGEGAIGEFIDIKLNDDMAGEKTFEKAERQMLYSVFSECLKASKKQESEIDAVLAGDLLDQIISATFATRNFRTAYLGLYNACATFTEALILGSVLIDGGYMKNVMCGTSSHFASAERQYRYPLELGCTRPPQSQWTVTGAGACILSNKGKGPKITSATVGRIVDYGVTDTNNMGAAMAAAACDTLVTHFKETGFSPCDYDLIISGDLGTLGSRILKDLTWEKGFDIEEQHVDCGEMVYNINEKEYQGGSGAGCSSMTFCSYFYRRLKEKKFKKILLMTTGALLSPASAQQGESIPGIAHAVVVEC